MLLKLRQLIVVIYSTLFMTNSVAFGSGVNVPEGDQAVEEGHLHIITQCSKGSVFLGSPVQTTAAAADFKTILHGCADPIVQDDLDGDFYSNTASNMIFGPKAAGAWPAGVSLLVPQGSQVATGSADQTGATGAQGSTGLVVPNGTIVPSGTSGTRFTDNGNGTVTDNLSGLIWLKNANCTDTSGTISKTSETMTWTSALTWSNNLANGLCGLTDGSTAGQWRLPNREELLSLVDQSAYNPALPTGHLFTSVQSNSYWSSSSSSVNTGYAWGVSMNDGFVNYGDKANSNYVLPVRVRQ